MKRLLALLGLLGAWGAPSVATTVPRFSLEELSDRSELVVHGRCLRTWSAWDAEHKLIWTHSEIEVVDSWKGAPGASVIVSEPGGIVDGIGLAIEGVPHHHPGEEMVVFLYRTPIGYWRARGLTQGKFQVTTDRGGVRRVRTQSSDAAVVDPAGRQGVGGTDLRRLDGASLEELKTLVRLAPRSGQGKR